MIRHGKKVNKTQRYYTNEDIRKACKAEISNVLLKATTTIHEIHEMAFRDYIAEHAPRINLKTAILDYNALIEQYSNDYEEKKFSLTQLKEYNRDVE